MPIPYSYSRIGRCKEARMIVERFRNGLRLLQASWNVLRQDREMLLLPVLSALSSIALLVVVFFAMFADDLQVLRDGGELAPPTTGEYIVLGLVAYLLTFITIFFNVAQIRAADDRMAGGDPTLRSAISDATKHLWAIAPWALVSMVVSMVLRAIEERAGWIGKIAAGLLGLAWALITYLVLPILVLEGIGVREAIARSKELFLETWGETVSGELGMSLVAFVAVLVPLPFLLLIGGGGRPVMAGIAIALGLGWLLLVATVMGALNMVFRVTLYRYASGEQPPEEFAGIDFGQVFPPKRRRGLFGASAS
jgi:hypothetical protein